MSELISNRQLIKVALLLPLNQMLRLLLPWC